MELDSSVKEAEVKESQPLIFEKSDSLSVPYIFVLSTHAQTSGLEWQAIDLKSKRWFVLPPMPPPHSVLSSVSCASLLGSLYVLGGMESSSTKTPLQSLITYSTSTNKWVPLPPVKTPRALFASIGSRIYSAGGPEGTVRSVESYDPATGTWRGAAKMRYGIPWSDAVVVGSKIYIAEGWGWPFYLPKRGVVYDAERDAWEEMSPGMRQGWNGIGVVLDGRLFTISEHADCWVKFYVGGSEDKWRRVSGGDFPKEAVQMPFGVCAVEGMICVVGRGLNFAVGRVFEQGEEVRLEWEAVQAPKPFQNFLPRNSQVVYG